MTHTTLLRGTQMRAGALAELELIEIRQRRDALDADPTPGSVKTVVAVS